MIDKIIKFNNIPHPSLQRKLAQSGHSFYEAIFELLDNSLDARATDIDISITNAQKNKYKIVVTDNGVGMNDKGLITGVQLGASEKSSENGDLGLFGLGLKTSLGALGMLHEIESTKKGSTKRHIYRNDDNVVKTDHKSELIQRVDSPKNYGGTIVKVGELKYKTKEKLLPLKERTAKRYSKILENNQVTLTINNTKIKSLVNEFDKNIPQITGNIKFNGNSYPYFFGYLIGKGASNYGVNLYKNFRIIEEEKKDIMGFVGRHQQERNIYGEIFMNDFDTDHQKTQFIRSDQWYEFEKAVKKEIREWRITVHKYNVNKMDAKPVAKDTQDKINNILKKIARHFNKTKMLDEFNFNTIEKDNKENETSKLVPESSPPASEPKNKSGSGNKGVKGSNSKGANPSIKWRVGGVLFDMKYHVEDLQDPDIIKKWDLVNETTLNVIINNGGRVYNGITETTAFISQEIVNAFVQCLIKEKGIPSDRGFEIRDEVLNSAYL